MAERKGPKPTDKKSSSASTSAKTPVKPSTVATSRSANGRVATPTSATRHAPAKKPTSVSSRPHSSATVKAQTAKPVTKPPASKPAATRPPAAKSAAYKSVAATTPEKGGANSKVSAKPVAKSVSEKKRNPAATPVTSKASSGSAKSGTSAARDGKVKIIVIAAICIVLVAALVIGLVVGLKSCRGKGEQSDGIIKVGDVSVMPTTAVGSDKPDLPSDSILVKGESSTPVNSYVGAGVVGYSAEVLGTVQRKAVTVSNEGLSEYPKYGTNLNSVLGGDDEQKAKRSALVAESAYLAASTTANGGTSPHPYNMMDAQGGLYYIDEELNKTPSVDYKGDRRHLYKHTASDGMYLGNVSDDEPRIIKRVTMRPRGYDGYGVTGVYAPAGEVIRIQLSEKDMNATGGITIHIGQALYNGQANNIWVEKNQMPRMPVILNTMVVNKNTATLSGGVYTAYVGSFFGGPIYIRNTNVSFTVTVTGGVNYSHFILGYTTKEEFEANANSSAPYFDLEVWDRGILHSGPKTYALGKSYDDIYKAATLWEKVASVTTTGSNQGIVMIYDPFVAAGAAVAFPGRRSVNCPLGWMSASLDYDETVTSGCWGNFHEYHHNFQGYGVGNGGEVTNNGMTLVSYALFTKISAARGIGDHGAQGLDSWNRYTSATWALDQTLKIARADESPDNGDQGLALYATLLHNFGADAFIKAKVTQTGGQNYTAYMNAWQNVTHNNMLYYFKDILKGTEIDESAVNAEYPMFVPVSCVYQTGRSYMYDGAKKYFRTMRPYVIPLDKPFDIDLSKYAVQDGEYAGGSIVIPDGFSYRLKSVTRPKSGEIEVLDNGGTIRYIPDANGSADGSGQIVITLGITRNDGAFKVDDVDLVLEFDNALSSSDSGFVSDYFYTRAYNRDYTGEAAKVSDGLAQTYVAGNYKPWDNSGLYDITNLFDGDPNTGIHTDRDLYVSDDSPAVLTVDLGKEISANSIVLYPNILNANCRNAFPKAFTLEGSLNGVDYFEMGKWTDLAKPEANSELIFDGAEAVNFRYYRLTVTATHSGSKRFALGEIEFVSALRLIGNGQNVVAPADSSLVYGGEWKSCAVQSSFGYAYLGKAGSKIGFEFIGTRLAVSTSKNYEENFEVYIDGVKCESVEVVPSDGEFAIAYISQKLKSGNHKVEIRCSGEACFDSFAVFDETRSA